MFIRRPSDQWIAEQLVEQVRLPFTYPAVGATSKSEAPAGYTIDHHRVYLGTGRDIFENSAEALRSWGMFKLPWIDLCWPHAPIETSSAVAVLARYLSLWWLNCCRIVYVIEEDANIQRFGFASGTLPLHAERGEERFLVEWHHADDSVWFDLFAFSQPNQLLVKTFRPLARRAQKRFARQSLATMVRVAGAPDAQ